MQLQTAVHLILLILPSTFVASTTTNSRAKDWRHANTRTCETEKGCALALIRSLNTAVSGLKAQQFRIEVIGNNIANVDTTAFKGSRVDFASLLSQTVSYGVAPQGFLGGIIAEQQVNHGRRSTLFQGQKQRCRAALREQTRRRNREHGSTDRTCSAGRQGCI